MVPKIAVGKLFLPLQTASFACFPRKIQLSGFSACPDGSPSQLIRISGIVLYTETEISELRNVRGSEARTDVACGT